MSQTDLFASLSKILVDQFGVPADDVKLDATFESLGLDSLDLVEVTLVIDEEMGLRIPDEKLGDITTPGDAVDVLIDLTSVDA
jgi:acyl carrier protein